MSRFKQIVKNIALENKKCNYNPKIDMNWCNLPMEMRNETRLSATSKTEKSLVEAKKFQFHRLHIVFILNTVTWKVTAATKLENREYDITVRTFLNLDYGFISAVLKNAEVKNLRLYSVCVDHLSVEQLLDHLAKFAPFRFERVSVCCFQSIAFFMKNCPNLKKVDHAGKEVSFPSWGSLDLPSITKINEFRLSHLYPAQLIQFLDGLVQKWIDYDAEAGKSVQCILESSNLPWNYRPDPFVNMFAKTFAVANRIIDKTADEVKIRMDNPMTQILLRRLGLRVNWINTSRGPTETTYEFVSCKVIPIDLPKAEYGIGDEWIQAAFEKKRKLEDAEDQEIWGHLLL